MIVVRWGGCADPPWRQRVGVVGASPTAMHFNHRAGASSWQCISIIAPVHRHGNASQRT